MKRENVILRLVGEVYPVWFVAWILIVPVLTACVFFSKLLREIFSAFGEAWYDTREFTRGISPSYSCFLKNNPKR